MDNKHLVAYGNDPDTDNNHAKHVLCDMVAVCALKNYNQNVC